MARWLRFLGGFMFMMIFTLPVAAQDHGVMLRFDGAPNLSLKLTTNLLQKSNGILYESSASAEITQPWDRILFNGTFADTNIAVLISYEKSDGAWSEWREAFVKYFSNGRFWARLDVGSSRRLKYRLVNRGVKSEARLEIYAVEAISEKDEEREERISPLPERGVFFSPADSIPQPAIISREQWGAQPPRGEYVPHTPYRFAQHHTAGRRVQMLADGLEEMRFIQDFHQNGRGWQDIGYHFLADDAGRIYAGVPPQYRGTHVGNNNTGNIGISLMGNYHIVSEFPTQASLDSLVNMWSWLAFTYGVNPDSLFGHRNYTATDCPGDNVYVELPDMRSNVRKQLGFGAPYVANPLPQPFSQEVSPHTQISFQIRDDEEGVDENSIAVSINGQPVTPAIIGSPQEWAVSYAPPSSFGSSQNVIVQVTAADLAATPDTMHYSYRFQIRVEAQYAELQNAATMQNAALQLVGSWSSDASDVILPDLSDGIRLIATDIDNSHTARVYPNISETGDYLVNMAMSGGFLGESASYRFVSSQNASHPAVIEYNIVFSGKWAELSPTPVHFEAGSPSTGFIELSGSPDVPTRLVLDAFRFEKVDRLDPPQPPTLKWVHRVGNTAKEIEVAWYPTLEGDIRGYRLFMSEDGRTWNQPLVDENVLGAEATSFSLNYSGSSPTVYFRMVTVDTNEVGFEGGTLEPLVSEPTDTYGVGLLGTEKILVVDNFDRRASWSLPYHAFVRSHGEALAANGFGFDSCNKTAVQTGEITLDDYTLVIYFCGDDSRANESLAAADQWRLLSYLENGGKLFISGSEIGYDFASTTSAELERYHTLLRAEYLGDGSGSNTVQGEAQTIFEGLSFSYGTANSEDTYIEDYPDYIETIGSTRALRYGNNRVAAVAYTGRYGSSSVDAQVIYLAFPFETIMIADARVAMMERALKYFGFNPVAVHEEQSLPVRFVLSQNYPNPFSPHGAATSEASLTTIRFELPRPEQVTLSIYNILGQRVAQLANRRMAAGKHTFTWDGRSVNGALVPSGQYFYRVEAGEFHATRRLMVVR